MLQLEKSDVASSKQPPPASPINVIRQTPTIVISNPLVALGEFSFSFATVEEWDYRVECRDPDGPTNWLTVTNIMGDGATAFVTNTISTNTQKFFRVVAE